MQLCRIGIRSRQQDRKLVSPQARDGRAGACRCHEATPDFLQQAIACGMSKHAVNDRETVNIEQGDRTMTARRQLFELVDQPRAIRQAGEAVGIGQMQDALFTAGDAVAHHRQRTEQGTDLIAFAARHVLFVIAGSDRFGDIDGFIHRSHDAAGNQPCQNGTDHQRNCGQQDHDATSLFGGVGQMLDFGLGGLLLH